MSLSALLIWALDTAGLQGRRVATCWLITFGIISRQNSKTGSRGGGERLEVSGWEHGHRLFEDSENARAELTFSMLQ